MVQAIKGNEVTLAQLEETFQLERTDNRTFFPEWQEDLPELTALEQQALDEVRQDYLHLSRRTLLEAVVKMVVLSPLLRRAGFYRDPFYLDAEEEVELVSQDEETVVRGRIDILIYQPRFWVLAIEAKQKQYSLDVGLAQVLFYMLAQPQPEKPAFGFLTNGGEFRFLKLSQNGIPRYGVSHLFSIDREGDLYTVVKVLKRLGQIIG